MDQDNWTTEEKLIMKSTAVPLPSELANLDVVSQTNELWALQLEYKKDLEETTKEAAEKAAEKVAKQTASRLIQEGLSLEKISEITDLPLEQVKALTPT
jgi:predicted transposase/invertase (TIGR01784 family)